MATHNMRFVYSARKEPLKRIEDVLFLNVDDNTDLEAMNKRNAEALVFNYIEAALAEGTTLSKSAQTTRGEKVFKLKRGEYIVHEFDVHAAHRMGIILEYRT